MPDNAAATEWMLTLVPVILTLWVGAFGACVGSLINVLVYRLPRGLDVVTPASRCPSCDVPLTWRENIPIFGWIILRGRCRFCRAKISPEYVIVETATALLWMFVFVVLYAEHGRFLGIPVGLLGPDWGQAGFRYTWPAFAVVVILFSCLIAVTLIDARTFHIPMPLVIVPVITAILAHPLHALWIEHRLSAHLYGVASGWEWTIPTPGPNGWRWVGATLGALLGLVVSNTLLSLGLIGRSFADYDEWARCHAGLPPVNPNTSDQAFSDNKGYDDSPELWTRYPYARREMVREMAFLAPAAGLGMLGSWLADQLIGPAKLDLGSFEMVYDTPVPLWLSVLTGVLMGYLIGGGLVWGIRILGSLAFGKEAMGLGDVHLMAAVGACLGWIDSTLAFFGGAVVGAIWAVLSLLSGGRIPRHLPFGPYLALATMLVWFLKPFIAHGLGLLTRAPQPLALP